MSVKFETQEQAAAWHRNLEGGLFKLEEALHNKAVSGLLLTDSEVAAILYAVQNIVVEIAPTPQREGEG